MLSFLPVAVLCALTTFHYILELAQKLELLGSMPVFSRYFSVIGINKPAYREQRLQSGAEWWMRFCVRTGEGQ